MAKNRIDLYNRLSDEETMLIPVLPAKVRQTGGYSSFEKSGT